jgi:hypothetical protein
MGTPLAPPTPPNTPLPTQVFLLVVTGLCAGFGGILSAQFAAWLSAGKDKKARQTADRLELLDPLSQAAESLGWKLRTIADKIRENKAGNGGLQWMLGQFHGVKHQTRTETDYANWCNGEGFFAVSTVYATAILFATAMHVRRKYISDTRLVKHLDAVSDALAEGYGIYHMIQDSVGENVTMPSGQLLTYRLFCERLHQEQERAWFLNVIDYYREVDKKSEVQRAAVRNALNELLTYLPTVAKVDVRNPFAPDEVNRP